LVGREMREYMPEPDVLRERGIVFQRISGDTVNEVLGDGADMRLLSYYHVPEAGAPFIIQVAMDLETLHTMNRDLRGNFLRISLLSLAAAGLTSWLLSKRSLQPIEAIKDQVAEIEIHELDQRIDIDDSAVELESLTKTVNEMLARLDRSFNAQSDFLNHAAHELKTPLAVLLGETQRMRRAPREVEDYESNLMEMEQELLRLAKVVDSLLMLAKARAGTRDLDEAPVSANDFVTEALERCQPIARHREIKLDTVLAYDAKTDSEPIVLGDERLLIAMVENLVRNSVRLSPVGTLVRVVVAMDQAQVMISVQDEGPGIPEEQRATLFTAFFSEPVEGRSSGGTGIGLAIVNSVVKLHRGEISVNNRETGGAEFVITFPLHAADETSPETGST